MLKSLFAATIFFMPLDALYMSSEILEVNFILPKIFLHAFGHEDLTILVPIHVL